MTIEQVIIKMLNQCKLESYRKKNAFRLSLMNNNKKFICVEYKVTKYDGSTKNRKRFCAKINCILQTYTLKKLNKKNRIMLKD